MASRSWNHVPSSVIPYESHEYTHTTPRAQELQATSSLLPHRFLSNSGLTMSLHCESLRSLPQRPSQASSVTVPAPPSLRIARISPSIRQPISPPALLACVLVPHLHCAVYIVQYPRKHQRHGKIAIRIKCGGRSWTGILSSTSTTPFES